MPIPLKDGFVVPRIPLRIFSHEREVQLNKLIDKGLADGVFVKEPSAAAAAPHIFPKPNDPGVFRMTVDFRKLNEGVVPFNYPMPNAEKSFEALKEYTLFSKIDLREGYHQLRIVDEDRWKTGFVTRNGAYTYTRVPMGLTIAPNYFQYRMRQLLEGLNGVEVFVDDIVVGARSCEEMVSTLRAVFERLRGAQLRLKRAKCTFGATHITYLGLKLSAAGITIDESRKKAIVDMKVPASLRQVRSFLGFCNFFRRFVQHYAKVAQPLYALMSKTAQPVFPLVGAELAAVEKLREALLQAPLCSHVDYNQTLYLRTDASEVGVGAVLYQVVADETKTITFLSRAFRGSEVHWSVVEKEAYALFWAVTKLESFLLGHVFEVETDSKTLTYLHNSTTPKLVRWRLRLAEFRFTLRHIPGEENVIADGLSRCLPISSDQIDVSTAFRTVHNWRVGHHQLKTTMEKLREAFPTHQFAEAEVAQALRECATCQKLDQRMPEHPSPHFVNKSFEPFVLWSMDHIVALPEDAEGHTAIFVLVDHFTRYTMLFPVRSTDAAEVARCLLTAYGTFGAPAVVMSDNGTAFTSEVLAQFHSLLGVETRFTVAYNHEQNGMVERCNKEVLRLLRAMVFDRLAIENWGAHLPIIQSIINSTKFDGFSPNELVFGLANNSRRSLFLRVGGGVVEPKDTAKFLKDTITVQKRMMQKAAEQEVAEEEEVPQQFKTNSWVLVDKRRNSQFAADLSKLAPTWLGPYQIRSYDKRTGVYQVEDFTNAATGKNILSYHVSQLKEFVKGTNNPVEVAAKDRGESVISSILQHSGSPTRKTAMKFLVQFADGFQTWMGYNELKNTAALAQYSSDKRLNL
jgi:transposase InsO family protein